MINCIELRYKPDSTFVETEKERVQLCSLAFFYVFENAKEVNNVELQYQGQCNKCALENIMCIKIYFLAFLWYIEMLKARIAIPEKLDHLVSLK